MFEKISEVLNNFTWLDALDIAVIAILFYFVLLFFHNNNLNKLLMIFVVIIALCCALLYFSPQLLSSQILKYVLIFLPFCLVIVYSNEIKRALTRLNAHSINEKHIDNATDEEIRKTITNLVRATQNLAKHNTGALIVLSKGRFPGHILESGTSVNATVSSELLETIFINKSPLHDGAVIIQGSTLLSAGCLLPLSQDTDLPKDFGTRHRAAVGVTEQENAQCIVVSEETGIISYANAGKIKRYVDSSMLNLLLEEFYGLKHDSETQKMLWRKK